jgi:DNA-binding transcriptional ArsR family regulator
MGEPVTGERAADSASIFGDAEISKVGSLLSDKTRCQILLALNDGRALPASVLAQEAGIVRSTVTEHLSKLTEAGLLAVESHGRFRYYRLASDQVGWLLEGLTQLAPPQPVRSLREGTRAARLRTARTCYDHLAGKLGVSVMAAMLRQGYLDGGSDNVQVLERRDRPSGYGRDLEYVLTESGWEFLDRAQIKVPEGKCSLVRYCVDWSEQQHHLAGLLGRAVLNRFVDASWITRERTGRTVIVTSNGQEALADLFGVVWPPRVSQEMQAGIAG